MSSESQSTTGVIEMVRQGELFAIGEVVEGTEGIERLAKLLETSAHPDFVTVMTSHSGLAQEYVGVDGFRQALGDWISPYEDFRLEIDETILLDDRFVFLVRQVGTTKHDGVKVETQSGSVWSLLDGKVRQATFYLDRQAALEAAGVDPDSR
jgi:ketosteroid isomerase-like protein